jgi:hypothetical protein
MIASLNDRKGVCMSEGRTIYGPFKCILSDEKNKKLKVIE